jgi:hypothetical protein
MKVTPLLGGATLVDRQKKKYARDPGRYIQQRKPKKP